ncbi:unnamed protein product [Caretta caretta]
MRNCETPGDVAWRDYRFQHTVLMVATIAHGDMLGSLDICLKYVTVADIQILVSWSLKVKQSLDTCFYKPGEDILQTGLAMRLFNLPSEVR